MSSINLVTELVAYAIKFRDHESTSLTMLACTLVTEGITKTTVAPETWWILRMFLQLALPTIVLLILTTWAHASDWPRLGNCHPQLLARREEYLESSTSLEEASHMQSFTAAFHSSTWHIQFSQYPMSGYCCHLIGTQWVFLPCHRHIHWGWLK